MGGAFNPQKDVNVGAKVTRRLSDTTSSVNTMKDKVPSNFGNEFSTEKGHDSRHLSF